MKSIRIATNFSFTEEERLRRPKTVLVYYRLLIRYFKIKQQILKNPDFFAMDIDLYKIKSSTLERISNIQQTCYDYRIEYIDGACFIDIANLFFPKCYERPTSEHDIITRYTLFPPEDLLPQLKAVNKSRISYDCLLPYANRVAEISSEMWGDTVSYATQIDQEIHSLIENDSYDPSSFDEPGLGISDNDFDAYDDEDRIIRALSNGDGDLWGF